MGALASSTLRQFVYAHYLASQGLQGLGFTEENISPNFSPDSPQGDLFMVLRWGITIPGIGAVNRVRLSCWVYNRQPDYGPIADALKVIRDILPGLDNQVMSPTEAILTVNFEGDSEDGYDDGYRAYTRYSTHNITASGS